MIMQALRAVSAVLPPPVVIKHALQPLLMSLPQGPHIALGLVSLVAAADARTLSTELLPSLVAVLTAPAAAASQLSPARVDANGHGTASASAFSQTAFARLT